MFLRFVDKEIVRLGKVENLCTPTFMSRVILEYSFRVNIDAVRNRFVSYDTRVGDYLSSQSSVVMNRRDYDQKIVNNRRDYD